MPRAGSNSARLASLVVLAMLLVSPSAALQESLHMRKLMQTACALPAAPSNSQTTALTITVKTTTKAEVTPQYMGIGLGHRHPDSNWAAFLKRQGANAGRFWAAATDDIPTFIGSTKWGQDLNGALVDSKAKYEAAVAQLSTPQAQSDSGTVWINPVRWADIETGLKTIPIKANDVTADKHRDYAAGHPQHSYETLKSLGIEPLIVLDIGCGGSATLGITMTVGASDYWTNRWEMFKYAFAMGWWAHSRDITFIEPYNEADLDLGGCMSYNEWRDTYLIVSSAVHAAYKTLNGVTGKSLAPRVTGSAFARSSYSGDNTRYLGSLTVTNDKTLYPSLTTDASGATHHVDRYSFHTYGKSGSGIKEEYLNTTAFVTADKAGLKVAITEHQAHTAGDWDTINTTPDAAVEASTLAAQVNNLVQAGINEHYVFKFSASISSTYPNRQLAKNGVHWAETGLGYAPAPAPNYNVADSTLSAEAFRLLATHLKGGKTMYDITESASALSRTFTAVRDGPYWVVFAVNDNTAGRKLTVSMAAWKTAGLLAAGGVVLVSEASAKVWGEVNAMIALPATLPSTPTVVRDVQPNSLSLFRIPAVAQTQSFVAITDDAHVSANTNKDANFGAAVTLMAGTDNAGAHQNTYVTLLKYDLTNASPAVNGAVNVALLQLTVASAGTSSGADPLLLSVLGVPDQGTTWDPTTVSWSKYHALNALTTGAIDQVALNFVNWQSATAKPEPVGHVYVEQGTTDKDKVKLVDVTKFVQANPKGTLLVYRPLRRSGYEDHSGTSGAVRTVLRDNLSNGIKASFHSAQATSTNACKRPRLILYSSPA